MDDKQVFRQDISVVCLYGAFPYLARNRYLWAPEKDRDRAVLK
jgi:hypothetical protein